MVRRSLHIAKQVRSGTEKSWCKALDLFSHMFSTGNEPDMVAYTSSLMAAGQGMQWQGSLGLLAQMRCSRTTPDAKTFITALGACAKGGAAGAADGLLATMGRMSLKADVVGMTSVVAAHARSNHRQKVVELLDRMQSASLEPNDYTLNFAIESCGTDWAEALSIFCGLCGDGFRPGAAVYDALIGSCGSVWGAACELLELMLRDRVDPSAHSYARTITSCCAGARQADELGQGAASDMWKRALVLLIDGESRKVDLDVVAYNTALETCVGPGDASWECAIAVLRRMHLRFLSPNEGTYCALIQTCSAGPFEELAPRLLESAWGIKESRAKKQVLCAVALEACEALSSRRGTETEASTGREHLMTRLLQDARDAKLEMDAITYRGAIQGSGSSWRLALGYFVDMRAALPGPDANAHRQLCISFAKGNAWEHASAMLEMLEGARHGGLEPSLAVVASFNSAISACQVAVRRRPLL